MAAPLIYQVSWCLLNGETFLFLKIAHKLMVRGSTADLSVRSDTPAHFLSVRIRLLRPPEKAGWYCLMTRPAGSARGPTGTMAKTTTWHSTRRRRPAIAGSTRASAQIGVSPRCRQPSACDSSPSYLRG